jgi:methionyl aminopeptidase
LIDDSILDKYRLAGKVCAEAGEHAKSIVKPGMLMLDLATQTEQYIKDHGASLSFPVNLSLDDCAAHFSPEIDDTTVVPEQGVLKIDIGTHVDGYICDHAISVDVGSTGGVYQRLIDSSAKALDAAIAEMHTGVNVLTLGRVIEESITADGFLPIRNLGGHNLGQYSLHGGTFIPNIATGVPHALQAGEVFAIEPFATTGAGYVSDGPRKMIFRFNKRPRKSINIQLSSTLETIHRQFSTLPFSPRWLLDKIPKERIMPAVSQLASRDLLQTYPLLMEKKGALVSQAEHTVIIFEDHAEVTSVV